VHSLVSTVHISSSAFIYGKVMLKYCKQLIKLKLCACYCNAKYKLRILYLVCCALRSLQLHKCSKHTTRCNDAATLQNTLLLPTLSLHNNSTSNNYNPVDIIMLSAKTHISQNRLLLSIISLHYITVLLVFTCISLLISSLL
jgi:hypothetical protein